VWVDCVLSSAEKARLGFGGESTGYALTRTDVILI
jgi:hypothetical protein